jgi:hypothetical protein
MTINMPEWRFIRRTAVPLVVSGAVLASGLTGCVAVPAQPAYVAPAPVYVAPAPVYVAPAPVVVWGGWGWRHRWR